jgi:hypothetical protein
VTGRAGSIHRNDPTYQRRARLVREAAYANPHTRCQICGNTLPECAPHKNGRPAEWHAGHTGRWFGQVPELKPWCSTCNQRDGLAKLNAQLHGTPYPPPHTHTPTPTSATRNTQANRATSYNW